jgi:protein TonB
VNSNLPALREPGLRAHVIITLAVRADGTLESVDVNRPSGNPLVDDAIVGLVRLAAPFEPFSEAMRRETDVLHITRSFDVMGPAP